MDLELNTTTVLIILAAIGFLAWLVLRWFYLRRKVNEVITPNDIVVLKISIPRYNDKNPLAAEQLYSSLHGIIKNLKKSKFMFSFEIVAGGYGIYFMAATDKRYRRFLENQIFAQYPSAEIEAIKGDYARGLFQQNSKRTQIIELSLTKEAHLPIKTFNNFEVDPLAAITSAISKLNKDEEVWIQIVARPVSNYWQNVGKSVVNTRRDKTDAEGKKVSLESGESEELNEIEKKNTKVGFQFIIRVLARSTSVPDLNVHLEDVTASFKQYQTPHLNSLGVKSSKVKLGQRVFSFIFGKRLKHKLTPAQKFLNRFLDEHEAGIINIEELASIYHLPNKTVETPNIAWVNSKKLEYPLNLPGQDEKARIFGRTNFRGMGRHFGLKPVDRRRHMYVLGKTGTGKSTLMKNMIIADIYEGKGVGLLDPHGDLVEDILEVIPEHRWKDTILFDPSDLEYPIGLNLLKIHDMSQRDIIADGIVEVFKRQFGDSWGPRLQYILMNAILTLLECQNVSLLAIMRILTDTNYRKFLLKQVNDPIIKNFWETEYAGIAKNDRMLAEVLSPIQNKVGRFISSPMIRNMVSQVKAPIHINDIMDEGKIILVNLSQGKMGEENSGLLGGLFVTKMFSSAMERVNVPEAQRRDFYLYVDEFQNFATNTFIKILSEARKYGLNLIVAHQYIDQVSQEISDAIFGNVGTMATFTVGQKDAQRLEKEYSPYLTYEDLVNLPKYNFVTKMTIDGTQSKPFTALSLPPSFKPQPGAKEAVLKMTREEYAMEKSVIEEKIAKWSAQIYNKEGNLVTKSLKS